MNKLKILRLGLLVSILFVLVQCKQELKVNYDFNVTVPEGILKGYANRDTIEIPFDIECEYDMSQAKFEFSFLQGSLKGDLSLNGVELKEVRKYELKEKKNILKFTGKFNGQHQISLEIFNDKGKKVEKELYIDLEVADYSNFDMELIKKPEGVLYQGVEYNYKFKITPEVEYLKGYKIMFNSYNGFISLDNNGVELNKLYNINDINNINIGLKTIMPGKVDLNYTVVADNIEKKFTFSQEIQKNSIELEFDSVSANRGKAKFNDTKDIVFFSVTGAASLGNYFTFFISIKKTPRLSSNCQFKTDYHKEWINKEELTIELIIPQAYIISNNFSVVFYVKDEFENIAEKEIVFQYKKDL